MPTKLAADVKPYLNLQERKKKRRPKRKRKKKKEKGVCGKVEKE